jgi:hypothetical protein
MIFGCALIPIEPHNAAREFAGMPPAVDGE